MGRDGICRLMRPYGAASAALSGLPSFCTVSSGLRVAPISVVGFWAPDADYPTWKLAWFAIS